MRNKILLIYIGLAVLFMTTFPLCLGYLPFGAFRPRVILLLCTFLMASHVWSSSVFKKFLLFAIYVLIAMFAGGVFSIDGYGARFMEYALPILMFLTAISINEFRVYKTIGLNGGANNHVDVNDPFYKEYGNRERFEIDSIVHPERISVDKQFELNFYRKRNLYGVSILHATIRALQPQWLFKMRHLLNRRRK